MRLTLIAAMAAASLLGACQQGAAQADAPVGEAQSSGAPAPRRTADTGQMCDGFAGIACRKPGDFCKHPAGQCQVADGSGTCTPRPQVCTRIYSPVCGCDGKTYGNPCEADSAGARVNHSGECKAA